MISLCGIQALTMIVPGDKNGTSGVKLGLATNPRDSVAYFQ